MKTKKILSATCTTLLTIAFYTWMFHLGTVQKIRSNDSGGDTPKRLGSQPPDKAFYIQEPQYFCDSVLKINTSTDANYVIKVVDPAANEVILVIYLPAGDSREIGIPS